MLAIPADIVKPKPMTSDFLTSHRLKNQYCFYLCKLGIIALLNFRANGKLIRKMENILFQKQWVEILIF